MDMVIIRVGRVIHLDVKMFIPSHFLIKVWQNIKYYINNVKVNVMLSMGRCGSVGKPYLQFITQNMFVARTNKRVNCT